MSNSKQKIERLTVEQAAARYAAEQNEDNQRGWSRVAFWATQKHLIADWEAFVTAFLNTRPEYLKPSKREGVDFVPTEAGRKVKSRMGLSLKPTILYGDAMLDKRVQVTLTEKGDTLTRAAYTIIYKFCEALVKEKHTGDKVLTKAQAVSFFIEAIEGWHIAPSTTTAKNHQGAKVMAEKATKAVKSVTVKDSRDFAAAAVLAFMNKLPDDAKNKARRAQLAKMAEGISKFEC